MSLDPSSFMHAYKQAPERSLEKIQIEYAAYTFFSKILMRDFIMNTKPTDLPFVINAMRIILNVIATGAPDDYEEALKIMPEEMLSDAEEMFKDYQKSDLFPK